MGEYKNFEIHLKVEREASPIFCKHRAIPFAYKMAVEKELCKLEKAGVIRKNENCAWGTPLVPVLKTNGSIRLCADYKTTVNKYIKDVHYPFPKIEELFACMQGGERFTKLDFRNAYNQLRVDDETSKLLAWSTHKGSYEVLRLSYGFKPATAIFQREVERVFQGCSYTANLLDDLIVTGKTTKEHIGNVKEVLKRCREAGFKLNKDKCEFFKPSVKYLGHIIDKDGLRTDPNKVLAILNVPIPSSITEVKSFLGMVNYYRKFLHNMSDVLAP